MKEILRAMARCRELYRQAAGDLDRASAELEASKASLARTRSTLSHMAIAQEVMEAAIRELFATSNGEPEASQ